MKKGIRKSEQVEQESQLMDITKVSNERIQDLFTEEFEKNIAKMNDIDSFECVCVREANKTDQAKMEVTIYGLAGSPTMDDWLKGNLENAEMVVVKDEWDKTIEFHLGEEDIYNLNINDYVVVYKTV